MQHDAELAVLAQQIVQRLQARNQKIVFAESCTAGLLSATLSQIPGVSEYLCGSAVTYRNETKANWLHVSRIDLEDPEIGAVSSQVAAQMCQGVLKNTPEADIAASITGHLGPEAPPEQDGLIYVGIAMKELSTKTLKHQLTSVHTDPLQLRHLRQREAAKVVYQTLLAATDF